MRGRFIVSVPASSANLGPGFDALGMALDRRLTLAVGDGPTDEHHLAIRSFRAAGGQGDAVVRAPFPGGRGLGFSGAARVAGVMAAAVQGGADADTARRVALREAAMMEGHADNVAASVCGGVVAVAAERVVQVALGGALRDGRVVVWMPDAETSTKAARSVLPTAVPFADAVFNVGRVALLVAALAAGDLDALRVATADRLHQDRRLELAPRSRAVVATMIDAGAWCSWLSGSGPTVAALCARERVDAVTGALPIDDARVMAVDIDHVGARVERD